MTIPSLPTDNLYKFCALAGVALIAFGVYLQDNFLEKQDERTFGISRDNAAVAAEVPLLRAELEREHRTLERADKSHGEHLQTQKRVNETIAELSALIGKSSQTGVVNEEVAKKVLRLKAETEADLVALKADIATNDRDISAINTRIETTLGKIAAIQKAQAIIRVNLKEVELMREVIPWVKVTTYGLQIIGFFLAAWGFSQWRKIQKIQDALFFKESILKDKELDDQIKERTERDQGKVEASASG